MSHQSQLHHQRRYSIIFWIFMSIAVPLMVVVLGYSAGYRIDRDTGEVVTVAALAIETEPQDVTVRINGEVQETTTPYIETVQPGELRIALEKDGFHSWEKRVTVEPGRSILFPDVVLFLDAEATEADAVQGTLTPALELAGLPFTLEDTYTEENFDIAQTQYLDGPLDMVVDEKHGSTFLLENAERFDDPVMVDATVRDAEWLDNDVLVYATEFELWVYHREENEFTLLTRQSEAFEDITWHPSGAAVIYSTASGVYAMEVDPRDERELTLLSPLNTADDLIVSRDTTELQFAVDGTTYTLSLR